MIETIDRRTTIRCACGCGAEATLPHFIIVSEGKERYSVLPKCEKKFREQQAATKQLVQMVRSRYRWSIRVSRTQTIFRLQRQIGRTRILALRSAAIYGLPRKLGVMLSRVWTR